MTIMIDGYSVLIESLSCYRLTLHDPAGNAFGPVDFFGTREEMLGRAKEFVRRDQASEQAWQEAEQREAAAEARGTGR